MGQFICDAPRSQAAMKLTKAFFFDAKCLIGRIFDDAVIYEALAFYDDKWPRRNIKEKLTASQ